MGGCRGGYLAGVHPEALVKIMKVPRDPERFPPPLTPPHEGEGGGEAAEPLLHPCGDPSPSLSLRMFLRTLPAAVRGRSVTREKLLGTL